MICRREAEDQATIEGTIIQDPPGSIEQYGTPGEWKLTTVEACCGPDEGSSTTQMLPVYVACSDFPGTLLSYRSLPGLGRLAVAMRQTAPRISDF